MVDVEKDDYFWHVTMLWILFVPYNFPVITKHHEYASLKWYDRNEVAW